MKRTPNKFSRCITVLGLTLAFGLSADAESPREEVVHAFYLLKKADHDYVGHREAALREVETAGQKLGLELKGNLPDREQLWKSDAQLIEARRLISEAREKLEPSDRDLVASHLKKALKEIDIALRNK
jgi:hypothetical protein